ncbi:MAG TPA: hypothetical protein VFT56_11035 [Sphingomonas sp.]|nr:hypothetical protein [Sphingomonas sp.]
MADDTTNTSAPTAPIGTQPKKPRSSTAKAKAKISDAAHAVGEEASKAKTTAATTFKDSAVKLKQQATGKARAYAEDGKAKAGGALDEFSRLMDTAASSVDDSLGAQYGDYARSAAKSIAGFSDQLKSKDIDDLIEDLKNFTRKSPAVAVGTAAALGFVLARLVKSGLDSTDREA